MLVVSKKKKVVSSGFAAAMVRLDKQVAELSEQQPSIVFWIEPAKPPVPKVPKHLLEFMPPKDDY